MATTAHDIFLQTHQTWPEWKALSFFGHIERTVINGTDDPGLGASFSGTQDGMAVFERWPQPGPVDIGKLYGWGQATSYLCDGGGLYTYWNHPLIMIDSPPTLDPDGIINFSFDILMYPDFLDDTLMRGYKDGRLVWLRALMTGFNDIIGQVVMPEESSIVVTPGIDSVVTDEYVAPAKVTPDMGALGGAIFTTRAGRHTYTRVFDGVSTTGTYSDESLTNMSVQFLR